MTERRTEITGGLGVVNSAISVRAVAPDRIHNNWSWIVGGALAGLAFHTISDIGSSRLLAVAGAGLALFAAWLLERSIIRSAAPYPRGGRKALGVTDSHLVVFRRPSVRGRAVAAVASVPIDDVVTIRVDNGGWNWLRWLLTYAAAGVVVISEFVVFSPDLVIVGVLLVGILAAVVGSTVSNAVWVLLSDGRQWKFAVRAADWQQFHSTVPGFKWRGSGDGMRDHPIEEIPWIAAS